MTRPRVAARYRIGGVGVTIRADDPTPLSPLLARWSLLPCGPRARGALLYDVRVRPRRWRLSENGRSIHSGRPGPLAHAALRARLELAVYAGVARSTTRTPLHAAAVATPAGVVVLVGPSGAGKTSLALELQRRGAAYLGEEHAFVDDALQVSGLPRAQQLDQAPTLGREGEGGVFVPPLRVAHTGAAAGVVLLSRERRPEAGLEPVSPAEAAAHLTAATHRPPRPDDLRRLATLAGRVPVLRCARDGVAGTAELILRQWGG